MGNCTGKEEDNKENVKSNSNLNDDEEGGNVRPKPDFETRWKDDIIAIWARPIEKLPVHTDVPRLAKKITIKSDADDFIFDGSDSKHKTTNNSAITKMLLLAFAKAVDDKELRSALKKWDEFVPESGDTGEHLLAFFNAVITDAGETPSLLVLKAIHQRIIFPAFYCLKDLLQRDVGKFKDKRGSWSVAIHIKDNGTVVYDSVIFIVSESVVHKKRQQALVATPSNHPEFEFDWELSMTVDMEKKAMDKAVKITLSNLEFASDVDATQRSKVEDAIKKHETIS